MLRRAVALVLGEPVAGIAGIVLDELTVPCHLGNDRRRGDGRGLLVPAVDSRLRDPETRNGVAVDALIPPAPATPPQNNGLICNQMEFFGVVRAFSHADFRSQGFSLSNCWASVRRLSCSFCFECPIAMPPEIGPRKMLDFGFDALASWSNF